MNRASWVIARFYTQLALRHPVSLFAIGGMVTYTLLTSSNTAADLLHRGVEISALEVVFSIFNDERFLTYGMFFMFLSVAFSMFSRKDLEHLIASRASQRSDFWTAKVLAIMQIACILLGVTMVIVATTVAPNFPLTLEWSETFGQLAVKEAVTVNGAGFLNYLHTEHTPVSVAAQQSLLFFVSFTLVGTLGAMLVQIVEHQMVAFVAVSMYWSVALVSGLPACFYFLSPLTHLLLGQRSHEFPFAISFMYLTTALILVVVLGKLRSCTAAIGE